MGFLIDGIVQLRMAASTSHHPSCSNGPQASLEKDLAARMSFSEPVAFKTEEWGDGMSGQQVPILCG